MDWLRAILRNWLVPEVVSLEKASEQAKSELHEQVCRELEVIKAMEARAKEQLQGDMGALFFTFQGHKRIAVKEAIRLLLDHLNQEMVVVPDQDQELFPQLRTRKE